MKMPLRIRTVRLGGVLLFVIALAPFLSCGGDDSHEIPPEPVCATPTFAPPPGSYGAPTSVTISCETSDVAIRYTLDGSTPAESSTLYTQPILIASTKLLQARAWKDGYQPSDIATAAYTIQEEPCSIALTAPAGGETWTTGSRQTIRWTAQNCAGNVRIELVRGGTVCLTIAASAPGTGSYAWDVAACGDESSGYRIRITDIASNGHGESAADFEIAAACSIHMESPNGGETWTLGTARNIVWNAGGACGDLVRIDLLRAGTSCATIVESTENDGDYAWTAAACAGSLDGYRVRVTDLDTDASDESDADFSFAAPECVISLSAPNGGESWPEGSIQEIRWESTGCGTSVAIDLLRDGVVCRTIVESAENSGAFSWTAIRCSGVNGGYTIRVRDSESGVDDASNATFSIDGPAWSITVLSPDGGETWQEGTDEEIRWSANFDEGDVDIDLYRNGALCRSISDGTDNDGSFVWNAERCLGPTDGYTVVVSVPGGPSDASDAAFTISAPPVPCVIAVSEPAEEATVWSGQTEPILWTSTGCGESVRLDLLCNGAVCRSIDASTANDGTTSWTVSPCCADSCAHTIRVTDLASGEHGDSGPFCIRTCSLEVSSPAAEETWFVGSPEAIRWSTDGCGASVRIDLVSDVTGACRGIATETPNDGVFPWTVEACATEATGYTIRVTDLDSGVTAESATGFRILPMANPCVITVLSPNGGERWSAGSPESITWAASQCGGTVRIELLQDGAACATLAASTANDGTFDWIPTPCSADSIGYTIRITDLASETADASDATFTIPSCALAVTSPAGGEHWAEGSSQTIRWTSTAACNGPVKIELLCGSDACSVLSTSTDGDGSFDWTADACCDDPCGHAIRVTEIATGATATSPGSFCVCPACAPVLSSPNGGESWRGGSTHRITWDAAACGATVRLELFHDGALCSTIAASAPNTGSYDWTAEGCGGAPAGYRIRVVGACDATDASDATFEIPECALAVTSPAAGETWSPGTSHPITWSSGDCGGAVRIELWKGSTACATITESTPDDGSYDWTAQACVGGSGCDYEVRIVDTETGRTGGMPAPFCICPPCEPVVVAPNGGESWQEGSTWDIAWTPSACDASVKLELLRNGSVCQTIDASTANDGAYRWTAARCAKATDAYRVRVTGLTCRQSDASGADFTIPPMPCALGITSPIGGESWSRNTTHLIRWDSAGDCGDDVRIELLRNGQPCLTIAESTPNDETYAWSATPCDDNVTGYTIRVTELGGNKSSTSPAPFSIPTCGVQVTSPNGGENWMAETTQTISWNGTAACGSAFRIELLRNGAVCRTIAESVTNASSYTWVAQNCSDLATGYRIRVTDTLTGTSDSSDGDLQIPTPPCAISMIAPNGGESWTEGSSRTITWNATHCGPEVRIDLLRDGVPCSVIAASTPNTGSFAWNVETCTGAPGAWKIRITDLTLQTSGESGQAFQIPVSEDAYILPQNLTICRGTQNVEILLRGRNSLPLQGYGVSLCYDTAVFTCVGLSLAGTRGNGAPNFENDCGNGCARAGVIVSTACPPQIDAGDGPLLKLTLSVRPDAPIGTTTLDLRNVEPSNNNMARCGGSGVDPALLDGRVVICGGASR